MFGRRVAAWGHMLSHIATPIIVPPVNLAVLALLGVLLGKRRLAAVALALLLLLALPIVSGWLLVGLERGLPAASAGPVPQAIVILGGDVRHVPGPPGAEVVGGLTLERLRAGASLARATHLPILVTGGPIGGRAAPPSAQLMADSLAADFGTPARWVEPASRTTWENARFSAPILRAAGIRSVYVVTHAWHMRRALIAFAPTGLVVTPAPLTPDAAPRLDAAAFEPSSGAWRLSYFALHEWIGCVWYALRRAWG
jgi:uncharacterized SAM-binding protein YcdF (DUF218 family)